MKVVLEKITKKFPSRDKKKPEPVIAVNEFDFEIPDGKLIGLLGPSGCGKSTTLNLISGLEIPTSGKIYFGDDDVTNLEPQDRGIGLVFQNYALYPHLTVYQNIIFPLQNLKGENKMSKEQMREAAMKAADIVSLGDYMNRKPGELSGGQQQRVAIARALVKKPKVLLLDEPLSNLDARLRLQTREEIKRIQQETNVTTIFVTHDQEEAMSISDLIIVMKEGTLQQAGKPQEVYDNPSNLFVAQFLGTPAINVFDGKVEGGRLYIGSDEIGEVSNISDRKVFVAIRPEAFIPDENGPLKCEFLRREVMGRDSSIMAKHLAFTGQNGVIRTIINSDVVFDESQKEVCFSLKKDKVFIFDGESKERLYNEK